MKPRRVLLGLLGLALGLFLSACGGEDTTADGTSTGTAPTADETVTLDPADCPDDAFREANLEFCLSEVPVPVLEGPANESADFGDGVQARIVSATAEPAAPEVYDSNPTHDTLVTITTEITNRGEEVFLFPEAKMFVSENLLYGVNRYDAQGWAVYDDEGGSTALPQQLVTDTSAMTVSEFTLPAEGMEELTSEFNPNAETLPGWTFNGVEELL